MLFCEVPTRARQRRLLRLQRAALPVFPLTTTPTTTTTRLTRTRRLPSRLTTSNLPSLNQIAL